MNASGDVSFRFQGPRNGWLSLSVTAGVQESTVRCSHVYDPLPDLSCLFDRAALDCHPGAVVVHAEGTATCVRLDVEPGSRTGRLRVFEPGEDDGVAVAKIDAAVDCWQLADAWLKAFAPFVQSYDPRHWAVVLPDDDEPTPRRDLASVSLQGLKAAAHWVACGQRAIPP